MTNSIKLTSYIIYKSLSWAKNKFSLLLFPVLAFLFYLFIELIIFTSFYFYFGANFFNERALELWGLMSLWELSFFFFLFIAPLYFLITLGLVFADIGIAHQILFSKNNILPSFYESFMCCIARIKTIKHLTWVKTLLIIINESHLKLFFKKKAYEAGVADYIDESKADTWLEESFLVIPIITVQDLPLNKALKESRELMASKFGKNITATFSFNEITLLASLLGCFIIGELTSFIINDVVSIAIFFITIGLIITIIHVAESIFHTSVYLYCKNLPSKAFDSTDIMPCFRFFVKY